MGFFSIYAQQVNAASEPQAAINDTNSTPNETTSVVTLASSEPLPLNSNIGADGISLNFSTSDSSKMNSTITGTFFNNVPLPIIGSVARLTRLTDSKIKYGYDFPVSILTNGIMSIVQSINSTENLSLIVDNSSTLDNVTVTGFSSPTMIFDYQDVLATASVSFVQDTDTSITVTISKSLLAGTVLVNIDPTAVSTAGTKELPIEGSAAITKVLYMQHVFWVFTDNGSTSASVQYFSSANGSVFNPRVNLSSTSDLNPQSGGYYFSVGTNDSVVGLVYRSNCGTETAKFMIFPITGQTLSNSYYNSTCGPINSGINHFSGPILLTNSSGSVMVSSVIAQSELGGTARAEPGNATWNGTNGGSVSLTMLNSTNVGGGSGSIVQLNDTHAYLFWASGVQNTPYLGSLINLNNGLNGSKTETVATGVAFFTTNALANPLPENNGAITFIYVNNTTTQPNSTLYSRTRNPDGTFTAARLALNITVGFKNQAPYNFTASIDNNTNNIYLFYSNSSGIFVTTRTNGVWNLTLTKIDSAQTSTGGPIGISSTPKCLTNATFGKVYTLCGIAWTENSKANLYFDAYIANFSNVPYIASNVLTVNLKNNTFFGYLRLNSMKTTFKNLVVTVAGYFKKFTIALAFTNFISETQNLIRINTQKITFTFQQARGIFINSLQQFTLINTISRGLFILKASIQQITLTNIITQFNNILRPSILQITLNNIVQNAQIFGSSISQKLSITNTIAKSFNLFRISTQQVALINTISRGLLSLRTNIQQITFTNIVSRSFATFRISIQQITISNITLRLLAIFRSNILTLSLANFISEIRNTMRTVIQQMIFTSLSTYFSTTVSGAAFNSNSTLQSFNSTNTNTFTYCSICNYSFQINVTNSVNATLQEAGNNYTESAGNFITLIPLNEGNGNSSVDLEGNYNMSLSQGFTWYSGANCTWGNYQSGSCIRFDGLSGYGIINNTKWLSNSSNFTVVFDLNLFTPPANQERILDMVDASSTNGWQLLWQASNTLQFLGRNGTLATFSITSLGNIRNDTKYFIALEYNQANGSAFMWINNTQRSNFFSPGAMIFASNTNFTIARRSVGVTNFANITIDNLRIYNYSLTNTQVQNLYEAEYGGGSFNVVYPIYDGSNSSTKYINFSSQPAGTAPIIWYATNNINKQNFTNMGNFTINSALPPISIQINSTNPAYNFQDWANNFAYLNFTANNSLVWLGYQNNTLIENDTNLTVRFPFDESSGNTTVSSDGNNLIGYLRGNTTWSSDAKFGKGINFANGLSSRVSVSTSNIYNESKLNTFTWNVWVKFNTSQSNILPRIIDKNDYSLLLQQTTGNAKYGEIDFDIKNSTGSGFTFYFDAMNFSLPQNQNNWHMITGIFDNNVTGCVMASGKLPVPVRGLIDGIESVINYTTQVAGACQFGSTLFDSTSKNFTFGGNDGTGREFNGTIDEVRIYTRNLTDAEVQNLYLEGIARLGIGTYNYVLNTTGNQNYTNNSVSSVLTVSSTTTSLTFSQALSFIFSRFLTRFISIAQRITLANIIAQFNTVFYSNTLQINFNNFASRMASSFRLNDLQITITNLVTALKSFARAISQQMNFTNAISTSIVALRTSIQQIGLTNIAPVLNVQIRFLTSILQIFFKNMVKTIFYCQFGTTCPATGGGGGVISGQGKINVCFPLLSVYGKPPDNYLCTDTNANWFMLRADNQPFVNSLGNIFIKQGE